jgi:hypothetical protein
MPIGTSAGDNMVRATRSANTSNVAPRIIDAGSNRLLSLPINNRSTCGTINPMKLITPTNAVATDTMIVFSNNILLFSLSGSTPVFIILLKRFNLAQHKGGYNA